MNKIGLETQGGDGASVSVRGTPLERVLEELVAAGAQIVMTQVRRGRGIPKRRTLQKR